MKGIDISAWQEEVNWQGLLNEGFEFCIVKLGECDKLSDTFVSQVNEAVANGLKIGVYYYSHASTEQEAINEAEWVSEQVRSYFGVEPELGIWYDYEDPALVDVDMTSICKAFFLKLVELGICNFGLYSSYNWLTNYIDVSQLNNIPLWVAQYNYQNDYSLENPNANVRIWQFTDHISDELPYDGNIYYL